MLSAAQHRPTAAWLIWFVAACYATLQFIIQSTPSIISQGVAHDFHLSQLNLGFFASIYFYTYLLFQIPAGYSIDRIGPRRILLLSMPLSTLICLSMATVHDASSLFIMRCLLGITTAPAVTATLILAGQWFPPQQFALLAGLTECTCIAGAGLGQGLLADITMHWGWRGCLVSCGIVGLFLFLLAYFTIKDRPMNKKHQQNKLSLKHQMAIIMRSQPLLANGLFGAFSAALITGFAGMWGVSYLQVAYDISLNTAAYGITLTFIGIGISCIIIGWLSDYLQKRISLMLIGGFLNMMIFLCLLFLPLSLQQMYVALFLLGLSAGSYTLCFAIAKDTVPEHCRGAATAFTNMMTMVIGAPIYQPLIGELIELQSHGQQPSAHAYELALSIIPIGLLLGIAALGFIRDSGKIKLAHHPDKLRRAYDAA